MPEIDRPEVLANRVASHDRELIELRSEMGVLNASMSKLTTAVDGIAAKMVDLGDVVRAKGTTTLSDISAALQVAVYATVLIGAVVSGIVYVASNSNQVDVALVKYRLERLYGSFGWEPTIKRERDQ